MPDKKNTLPRTALIFGAVLTAALCWRWQRIFYLMCADYIISDMPAHVRLALGHNDYTLASVFVRALWGLLGEAKGQTALSLLLTGNQLLGLAALWLLLRLMFPKTEGRYLYLAALLSHSPFTPPCEDLPPCRFPPIVSKSVDSKIGLW